LAIAAGFAGLLGTQKMKLKADRATLLKALAHIQSVAEKRNTIPILANVLIAVRDGGLTLTATDMEIAVVEEVAASSSRNGATTAPAATRAGTRS
jgi:DNA polymerase-3 subunit beta